jgi:serine/threonine protein kinase
MSPEQIGGDAPRAASDLWSLAVTAYEALSGALPFEEENYPTLLKAIMTQAPRPIAGVPAAVAAWFDRALAKQPADRFPDAITMARAFEIASASPPPRRWPWLAIPVGLGVASVVAVAALEPGNLPAEAQPLVREPVSAPPPRAAPPPTSMATATPTPTMTASAPPRPKALPRPLPAPTRRTPKPYDKDETQ